MADSVVQALKRWHKDIDCFAFECCKFKSDKWQREFFDDVVNNTRVAACACKGPGKSAALAVIGWWWLTTRPQSQIAATSITADNLKGGLWKELSLWQSRSPLLQKMFTWTKTEININDHKHRGHWKAEARTWAKDADTNQQSLALAGLHSDFMMFLMDEVGGYPDAIMATAEAILASGKECKIVMAGNPTHCEGPLYAATTSRKHLWKVHHITGDPEAVNRSPRISKKWAREQIDQWGKDDPWVKINVMGEFPATSINALIGPDDVRAAMDRVPNLDDYDFSQRRLGIDVARFGDDSTVIAPRQGLWADDVIMLRHQDTTQIVGRVLYERNNRKSEFEMVDGTGGFGAGVVDGLRQAGAQPLEIHFSSSPIDARYYNKRAEMWKEMCDWIKRGGRLPKDAQLARELTAVQYTISKNGKLQLEEKDQVKKRLGFSPDRADALALTFALPEIYGNQTAGGVILPGGRTKVKKEWNPLDRTRW